MSQKRPHLQRMARLIDLTKPLSLDGFAFVPGPTLSYLTGLKFHLLERPVALILTPKAAPVLVLPEMELGKAAGSSIEFKCFSYNEEPRTWGKAFRQAARFLRLTGASRIGVEPQQMRLYDFAFLEGALPGLQTQPAQEAVAALRMHKDEVEVDAIRKAVHIAEGALEATLTSIRLGVTEREVAAELTIQLLHHGSDPLLPFAPTVAFGENAANPHAIPSQRAARPGDLILIDWGARHAGYISDLTRTFSLGEPAPECTHIAEVVERANQAGRSACRPGVTASDVDQAARAVIQAAGFAEQFFHRTGHGIGLEAHEEPSIRAGNPTPLSSGMVFTIEPGIYFAGKGGVRIEDNVVINDAGCETLSTLDRSLRVIG